MNIQEKYLTPSEWARPQKTLQRVKALIIHWVAKPNQSAKEVWNFWDNRVGSYGSGHYIIDLDGSIIHCIPDNEMAYHVGSKQGYTPYALKTLSSYPNNCTLGIELCHQDWEGSFTDATFDAAVDLCASLCNQYSLDPFENIMTHKFVVGWKGCPKWFSDHPEDFDGMRSKIKKKLHQ